MSAALSLGCLSLFLRGRKDVPRRNEADARTVSAVSVTNARETEQPQVQSFCTAELIHEIWVRLMSKGGPDEERFWKDRRHFFATASLVVQHLLVDHYRKRLNRPLLVESDRLQRVSDRAVCRPEEELEQAERFLALNEALERLDQSDPNAAAICRLR